MMSLHEEWITYGAQGQYSGYSARLNETKGSVPSVIIIQEIWGVDEHIQDLVRRFAQAGYVAIAPDLFSIDGTYPEGLAPEWISAAKRFVSSVPPAVWRDEAARKEAMAHLPEEQQEGITRSLGKIFNLGSLQPRFREHLAATSAFLRDTYPFSAGKGVASVGFCLGGMLSGALAATDPNLNCAVVFYGAPPAEDAISGINCPVMGFYGELDKGISDRIPAFAEAMERAGKSFSYQIYPNAPHAFFNDTRPAYHVESARDAFVRTLAFLNDHLT